jgi:L-alanine-DL-glutamate epimerase-like enolase superfamily enzyme
VQPLDRPGLGVDVDEALIASFAVISGPGYV